MPYPVMSVAQMRDWEKASWASGIDEASVIRRAGQAVARTAEALTRAGDFILFLAGRGHNGDDAAFAYDFLQGRQRHLLRLPEPDLESLSASLARRPALIVDGVFGIGLNRPLSPAWATLIEQINSARRSVLAVDVPSGLDAETGAALNTAVRASVTLTFGGLKNGLLAPAAGEFVGRLEVAADIGLVPCPFVTELNVPSAADFQDFPPPRPIAAHKGTFGHLAIIAGSRGYHGAAVLAARAAQRAQPGLITLLVPDDIYAPVASQLQAVMVRPYATTPELPESTTAVLAGPGLAATELPAGVREFFRRLWFESAMPIVADASALDWLPQGAGAARAVRVITPHPGEAARLLETDTGALQERRLPTLRRLSRQFSDCVVALKGHQTLVGSAEGPVSVNLTGNPHLAQGGSGDVLAGYIAGLLAQRALAAEAATAVRFAVWRHGHAADQLLAARPGFVVEDLLRALSCSCDAALASLPS